MSDHERAGYTRLGPGRWSLSGHWTVRGLDDLPQRLAAESCEAGEVVIDGSALVALDSAGAWVLECWLRRHGAQPALRDWPPQWHRLMSLVAAHAPPAAPPPPRHAGLTRLGRKATGAALQALQMLQFIGATALTAAHVLARPQRMRWRTTLREVQLGGFDALPIIGLTSFLLGVVVAYQGADQLRHYGANIFVVDLVGYAMLREFAPLISAIIIAGRSGSAYAAQIGTMVITEEVDALRTLDIDPTELLVLPKVLALALALPLLTVWADVAGVFGGMVMAHTQLSIGFVEFADRFGRELRGASLLIGVGKSLVFALLIALIGCFQGFRTRGSADSVGRQTTLAVVQAVFMVIVVDAAFSVVFSLLEL
ncbi:MAG: MlaE family lipid ABC transporter permease subunit [Burkholderiales bacterium]|nr:MlaE family lipid ABC transporter permease subunit [Burkholderiales bacterium]